MKVLDLFSGIGGFSLGLERAGMTTVVFCEIDPFCQKVLAKHWPSVYIHNDVKTLAYIRPGEETNDWILYDSGADHEIYRGAIDVITGGFPCQDISVAGKQAGTGAGTRSGLWSEVARLIGEIRPRYAIMENVTALLSGDYGRWFGRVLGDLAEIGYDAEWHCIPASELGAHHHRDRVWIICYPTGFFSDGINLDACAGEAFERQPGDTNCQNDMANPSGNRPQGQRKDRRVARQAGLCSREGWDEIKNLSNAGDIWAIEPSVGRVANGIPDRAHRLKSLGNAVVPQIPEIIGKAIMRRAAEDKAIEIVAGMNSNQRVEK